MARVVFAAVQNDLISAPYLIFTPPLSMVGLERLPAAARTAR
jgi:hypothetical protein